MPILGDALAAGASTIDAEVLNLWCAEGLRAVKLTEIQQLRFSNPVIESEFCRSLEMLATNHDSQKKTVSLHFAGDGKRKVQVGYVIEAPIWKTSNRLILDAKGKDKPYRQGWAMVENPTDEDWVGVKLALISGRPISFKMDLYNPLCVPRPTVEPDLFASLRPPTYNGGFHRRNPNEGSIPRRSKTNSHFFTFVAPIRQACVEFSAILSGHFVLAVSESDASDHALSAQMITR